MFPNKGRRQKTIVRPTGWSAVRHGYLMGGKGKSSGVRLDWRMLGEDPYASYGELVVMTFRGACKYSPASPLDRDDEPGPLAMTHSVNGEIQPFGEVNCDRVVNSARNAMFGDDYSRADLLIGRALGRVVTHELVHMLTKSPDHGTEGVEKSSLSGTQLIAGELPLSGFDIDRLKPRLQWRAKPLPVPVSALASKFAIQHAQHLPD